MKSIAFSRNCAGTSWQHIKKLNFGKFLTSHKMENKSKHGHKTIYLCQENIKKFLFLGYGKDFLVKTQKEKKTNSIKTAKGKTKFKN